MDSGMLLSNLPLPEELPLLQAAVVVLMILMILQVQHISVAICRYQAQIPQKLALLRWVEVLEHLSFFMKWSR